MSQDFNPDEYLEDTEEQQEQKKQPEIIRNDYGDTKDSTVVIEEEDRTVILTEDETIVIDKPEKIDIVPSNRPRKVYGGMWGSAEITTVSLALLAILTVILLYVFLVFPAQRELAAKRAERDTIEIDLVSKRKNYGSITDTQTQVAKVVGSINDFETRFLSTQTNGQTALYQRLNGLISAYGLTNSSGPDYAPLEIADPQRGQRGEEERGRDKYQSLFPGVYVSVTVDGSYQNLRRFIREVESSEQFITITSVEFVPAEKNKKDNANEKPVIDAVKTSQTDQSGAGFGQTTTVVSQQSRNIDRGKTYGETVSLKIEMVSYFRRPDFQPIVVETDYQGEK